MQADGRLAGGGGRRGGRHPDTPPPGRFRGPKTSKTRQRCSKRLQDGPRGLRIAEVSIEDAEVASIRLKRLPKRPERPPKALPRGPQDAKINFPIAFESFWGSRVFGFPTLQDGPRGPQDRPKTAQEAPKTAPRRPKMAPRRPKRPPRRPKRPRRRLQEGAQTGGPNGHF